MPTRRYTVAPARLSALLLPLLGSLAIVVLAGLLASCTTQRRAAATGPVIPGSNPDRGWQAIQDYGCIACHTIPGVPRADALVGPPLTHWAERSYIAGRLTNTPENLILWIQFPQSVDPGNAMPDMGVADQDARNIAAYLYTLRRGRWFD
jgi:cytochrome c